MVYFLIGTQIIKGSEAKTIAEINAALSNSVIINKQINVIQNILKISKVNFNFSRPNEKNSNSEI
jgi:hypothetical protein